LGFDRPSERARGFLTKSLKDLPSLACAALTTRKLSYGIKAVAKSCLKNGQQGKRSGGILSALRIRVLVKRQLTKRSRNQAIPPHWFRCPAKAAPGVEDMLGHGASAVDALAATN
jgi:hypothetical protein